MNPALEKRIWIVALAVTPLLGVVAALAYEYALFLVSDYSPWFAGMPLIWGGGLVAFVLTGAFAWRHEGLPTADALRVACYSAFATAVLVIGTGALVLGFPLFTGGPIT